MNNFNFLWFFQFWLLNLTWLWGRSLLFVALMVYFWGRIRFTNCFWATFNFHDSFNSDFWIWLIFLVSVDFFGPNGLFFGLDQGFKNCFWVHLCCWTTFIFYNFLNFDIWIWLNFGSFLSYGVLMGWFGGQSRVCQLFLGPLM